MTANEVMTTVATHLHHSEHMLAQALDLPVELILVKKKTHSFRQILLKTVEQVILLILLSP